jgi:hypothetical protein
MASLSYTGAEFYPDPLGQKLPVSLLLRNAELQKLYFKDVSQLNKLTGKSSECLYGQGFAPEPAEYSALSDSQGGKEGLLPFSEPPTYQCLSFL